MTKGLKSTLLTVAVALLGLNAMAMAPTIGNIPDVIIGDAEAGTASNNFVYPDAINLDNFVSDDNTPTTGILWSYTNPSGHYRINNVDPITSPDTNADTPGANELTSADDPDSSDSNKRTITIRNSYLSPLTAGASTAPYADPGATSDSQVIVLYASDSTTHALAGKAFMAYIVNNGNDALSGGAASVPVASLDFLTGTNGWVPNTIIVAGTTRQTNTLGLCAYTPADGLNYFGWTSQADNAAFNYNTFSYVNNAVYRVRMQVTTTAVATHVPVWGLVFENGQNYYGGTQLYFDNIGATASTAGANTPPSAGGRSVFETWLSAPSGGSAAFKAGITANPGLKDFRMRLQIVDIGNASDTSGYGAGGDLGEICWKTLQIDRYDMSDMTVESTPYNGTNLVQATDGTAGVANNLAQGSLNVLNWSMGTNTTNVTFSGGDLTIAPSNTTTAWNNGNNAYVRVETGDTVASYDTPDIDDNYPVVWESDQLYRVVFTVKAPDSNGENYPPDFIYIGADVPGNEITYLGYVTNKFQNGAMPKMASETEFTSFLYGNAGSFGSAHYQRIRPFLIVGTNTDFEENSSSPTAYDGNKGGITITSVRVEKVKF